MQSNLAISPRVTVYITSRDYGRFLRQAVDSVIEQTLGDWELLIYDDGSTDDTYEIALEYARGSSFRIECFRHDEPKGLRVCANSALKRAKGEFVMRLDADDYLDENALLVMVSYLDQRQDVGLVYPNWTYVNEDGGFLGIESRKKVGKEVQVLDLPAHGACTMIRRRVLKSVGGYDTKHDSQDGHELWLKALHRFKVGNVTTPLFFYRQHGNSMSRDERRLLESRQKIKRALVEQQQGEVKPRVVGIIPAKNTYAAMPNVVLKEMYGKPLIDYTLDVATTNGLFDEVYVTTDDPAVVEHCARFPDVRTDIRAEALSGPRATLTDVLLAAIRRLEEDYGVYADIVVLLNVHSPLRRLEHIQKAIDTLLLYDVDNVISTYEDYDLHFLHGSTGMQPLNRGMVSRLRYEREALFVDNGAVHAFWREYVSERDLYEGRIGHIVMPRADSYQLKSFEDWPVLEAVIGDRVARSSELADVKPDALTVQSEAEEENQQE